MVMSSPETAYAVPFAATLQVISATVPLAAFAAAIWSVIFASVKSVSAVPHPLAVAAFVPQFQDARVSTFIQPRSYTIIGAYQEIYYEVGATPLLEGGACSVGVQVLNAATGRPFTESDPDPKVLAYCQIAHSG